MSQKRTKKPRILCKHCETTFAVYVFVQNLVEDRNDWAEVGYTSNSGAGENGVFYCPFCGEGYTESIQLVDLE